VTVTSGDELEELATSFNTMTGRLGRQIHALNTMAEIGQAILAALDARKIVDTLLSRMRDVFDCDGVSVTLMGSDAPDVARTYVGDGNPASAIQGETIHLLPEEVQRLRQEPERLCIAGEEVPRYLAPLARRGIRAFVVLPIFLKESLSGILTLGYLAPRTHSEEDLAQARQLADQVAVALSNARLVEELGRLNWGTLTALARTIDAKSPWTAGHSERVTKMALRIGRALGLSPKELDVLHRGGLLHDIGKIGTPATILDKAGKLTAEETRLMRQHVRIGARILEPIAAYAEVIPIVLQHHEWFDGTGYPDGLSGEAISLGARIFAVADCFDALISDRPYRPGMDRRRVLEAITQGAGRQFDPKVVQAFLEVMAQEDSRPAALRDRCP
jgi:putative nucleotidyltransferase with HDIG domain